MGLAYIDLMKAEPYRLEPEKKMEIVTEYVFVAGHTLRDLEKDGVEFLAKEVEEKLDPRMIRDGINVLCQMKIKPDRHQVIERVLNLSDLSSEYAVVTLNELEKQIEFHPGIVLSWISAFKFPQFDQKNLKKFVISFLIHERDIPRCLLNNEESRKIIVSYLDGFLAKPRPFPKDELEKKFLDNFEMKKIEDQCYKLAVNVFSLESTMPNAVVNRILNDFQYQIERLSSKREKSAVIIQVLRAVYDHPGILKRIFPTLRRYDQEIVDGFIYEMDDAKVVNFPSFENLPTYAQKNLTNARNFVKDILKPVNPHMMPVNCGNFEIYWIGSQEQWPQLLQWLQPCHLVGFDIEANFVCQNSNGIQQAALFQISDGDTVYIIDVSRLKKSMDILKWNGLFELFFQPDRVCVGFDVNNDLKFLQSTFPSLKELFAEKQPKFLDLKKLTECVFNNSEIQKVVFPDGIPPTNSLKNLVEYICKNSLKKEEQIGNWENRPLRREQMIYAAQDARYVTVVYKDMIHAIHEVLKSDGEAKNFIECGVVNTVKPTTENGIFTVIGNRKSTVSDILMTIDNTNFKLLNIELNNENVKLPEDVMIVVDTPLLKVVPILRRCGYKTFDYREEVNEGTIKAAAMNQILAEFIGKNINTDLYFLGSRFPFEKEKFAGTLKSRWIYANQDQSDYSILETAMIKTKTIVNVNDFQSRCTKCSQNNTSFEIRIEAYRVIYRAFTKVKQYFDKKFGTVGLDDDERDKELLKNINGFEITDDGKILIINNESEIYKFLIDGNEAKVEGPEGIVKVYKAVNSLYDDETLEVVRFCKECAVFF